MNRLKFTERLKVALKKPGAWGDSSRRQETIFDEKNPCLGFRPLRVC
jgi:hypothetical protein